jgi:hypothetical protein
VRPRMPKIRRRGFVGKVGSDGESASLIVCHTKSDMKNM